MGKTSSQVKDRYNAKVYDAITFRVPKGEKETIKAHAEQQGESLNGFIQRSITETMKRDTFPQAAGGRTRAFEGGGSILTPETLKNAQEAAQAAGPWGARRSAASARLPKIRGFSVCSQSHE